MTVYVADMQPAGPYIWLWADTIEEAIVMVYAIGADEMARGPDSTWDHYRILRHEYDLALELGAEPTDRFGPAAWLAKRVGGPTGRDMLSRINWYREAVK